MVGVGADWRVWCGYFIGWVVLAALGAIWKSAVLDGVQLTERSRDGLDNKFGQTDSQYIHKIYKMCVPRDQILPREAQHPNAKDAINKTGMDFAEATRHPRPCLIG